MQREVSTDMVSLTEHTLDSKCTGEHTILQRGNSGVVLLCLPQMSPPLGLGSPNTYIYSLLGAALLA